MRPSSLSQGLNWVHLRLPEMEPRVKMEEPDPGGAEAGKGPHTAQDGNSGALHGRTGQESLRGSSAQWTEQAQEMSASGATDAAGPAEAPSGTRKRPLFRGILQEGDGAASSLGNEMKLRTGKRARGAPSQPSPLCCALDRESAQPEQAPVTFEEVAVHFTEEERALLDTGQRALHRKVMEENYGTLVSLGLPVPRSGLIFWQEEGDDPFVRFSKGGERSADTEVYWQEDQLHLKAFTQPMDRNSLLHFSSCHSSQLRRNLTFGQYFRLKRNSSRGGGGGG